MKEDLDKLNMFLKQLHCALRDKEIINSMPSPNSTCRNIWEHVSQYIINDPKNIINQN
jgi:hypothetical protein